MNITRQHIREATGDGAFSRGRDYFNRGRVVSISATRRGDDLFLQAKTLGSNQQSYVQDIHIERLANGVEIDGECSCPVGYNCKHVAAVCLSYEHEPNLAGSAAAEAGSSAVRRWVAELKSSLAPTRAPLRSEFIVYVLSQQNIAPDSGNDAITIEARVVKRRKNQPGLTRGRRIDLYALRYDHLNVAAATASDRNIARLLCAGADAWQDGLLEGELGFLALQRLLDSGCCYWNSTESAPLARGAERALSMNWSLHGKNALLELELSVASNALILPTTPAAYLDPIVGEIGVIDCGDLKREQVAILQRAPAIEIDQAERLSTLLIEQCPELRLPLPQPLIVRDLPMQAPTPCLVLAAGDFNGVLQHVLHLEFDYAGIRVASLPSKSVLLHETSDGLVRLSRDSAAESRAAAALNALGFDLLHDEISNEALLPAAYAVLAGDRTIVGATWAAFLNQHVAELTAKGWQIVTDRSFLYHFERAEVQVDIDDAESSSDWFALGFALTIGDEKIPLIDAIAPLLASDWSTLPETVTIVLDDYRLIDIPSARLRPVLETLEALFDSAAQSDPASVKLSRYDLRQLANLQDAGVTVVGGEHLQDLSSRLNNFSGITPVCTPTGLTTELRDYQQRGLDWLQFLREYTFNGILADDMGLGKTVQTLAHFLVEKNAGRLTQPVLLVAPTSLISNWAREAARFTPTLDVCILHGAGREHLFEQLAQADLVITSYALLTRDAVQLLAQSFHSVVLDEAQMIKNPRSKAALLVRQLNAPHRLCLTGTPMENHLGELWALFDFLMPGFLGSGAAFTRNYRTPIERQGDAAVSARLTRRIQPFMLRRTKGEVASELPPKTEIVRVACFGAAQAELYESIRIAMHEKVRSAIAERGLKRSQITILDALLKLRQTCCDPRLLPAATAQHSAASAKFDLLFELLPAQLEEGRRVLLFSQFTSMLELIEGELQRRRINYALLTGKTRNRDDAITSFRDGSVNLFLISLKAGGVGLNLSEADTVIHYDPWWNPAVEAQATDRAHRIGQQHPVFVYKLLIEDSVEEKLHELQAKKRALADGIYASGEGSSSPLLDAADLVELLNA